MAASNCLHPCIHVTGSGINASRQFSPPPRYNLKDTLSHAEMSLINITMLELRHQQSVQSSLQTMPAAQQLIGKHSKVVQLHAQQLTGEHLTIA